jgi:primary-amine oxidase
MARVEETGKTVRHPLALVEREEIEAGVRILRAERELADTARFVSISLHEPPKGRVLAWDGRAPLDRELFIVLFDRADGRTFEAVVSLTNERVVSFELVPGVQAGLLVDEYFEVDELVRSHPDFLAALERRGLGDRLELVAIDPVPAGSWGIPEERESRRLARALPFLKPRPGGNCYAKPIEGIVGLVDLNRREVLSIQDNGAVPLPPDDGEYEAGRAGPLRSDVKPLEIAQREGPSFELQGNELSWQGWRLRVGFTPREGLVLHTISFHGRPVLYRASFSEMTVPYGDSGPNHFHQAPFDFGENTVGSLANSLELGCDCLGEIRYLDAVVNDASGAPVTIRNAICIHEEDWGLLWKHFDFRSGGVETRRARRLVVSWIMTVGNYEYGFYWYLHQDGAIRCEVKLTGILQTQALAPGERPVHGALVAPQLNGIVHQHFFNVRLDLDVDGAANTVYEVHAAADPTGPSNPYGNAFYPVQEPLRRESEARQRVDPLAARFWKIVNPARLNAVGEPVGYRLVPGRNVLPFSQPDCGFTRRAGFLQHHLWVTAYDPRELHAAGDYPNQHPGGAGLPAYQEADRPLEETDVVVWYTFGHHHLPRPEDWPVMPVAAIGFDLEPAGFFDRNPTLDVPPPPGHCG